MTQDRIVACLTKISIGVTPLPKDEPSSHDRFANPISTFCLSMPKISMSLSGITILILAQFFLLAQASNQKLFNSLLPFSSFI